MRENERRITVALDGATYKAPKMLAKRIVGAGLLTKTTKYRVAIWRLASMDESQ